MNPYEKKCVACGYVARLSEDFCPSCGGGGECGAFDILPPMQVVEHVASGKATVTFAEPEKPKRGKRAA